MTPRRCSARGEGWDCERAHSARGYCSAHYNQYFTLGHQELSPIGSYYRGATALIRDENGHKRCTSCTEWKPETSFHKRAKSPDGLMSRCSECGRNWTMWANYRLTPERFRGILEEQGGCAVCGVESPESQWHVDHDHSCCPGGRTCGNCVRGILCNNCNLGIGLLGDDPEVLDRSARYLRKWKSVRLESGG